MKRKEFKIQEVERLEHSQSYEAIKRIFMLDVTTAHDESLIASVVLNDTVVSVFFKDYDTLPLTTGAAITAGKTNHAIQEIAVRLKRETYRKLNKEFDRAGINSFVGKQIGNTFVAINVFPDKIKCFSNVGRDIFFDIAEALHNGGKHDTKAV